MHMPDYGRALAPVSPKTEGLLPFLGLACFDAFDLFGLGLLDELRHRALYLALETTGQKVGLLFGVHFDKAQHGGG
jgi:hypothetical protein